jgi:folate-binding protein YgfZ
MREQGRNHSERSSCSPTYDLEQDRTRFVGKWQLEMSTADISNDYSLLRQKVAIVPLERDAIRLAGKDAVSYLQGQCSQDISVLGVGDSTDALLLEPRGRIDALIRVTRAGEEELIVDTDGGFGSEVIARLERFKLRVKVDISAMNWTCVAVRGPAASELPPSEDGSLRLASNWPGLSGFDLLGEAPHAFDGVPLCANEAWQAARIEAGIPLMGSEIDEKTIPAEAGLVERCVSFTKGCFTGQELVARLDSRGSNVARHLRGIVVAGDSPHQNVVRGTELSLDDKVVGHVTSVAWSPAMRATVGLAYVHRSVDPPSSVLVGGFDAEVRELPMEP